MPARYFPVQPSGLRMQPGLFRLGTDFGNGAEDSRFFQFDEQLSATLAAKERVLERQDPARALLARSSAELAAHEAVLGWFGLTLEREGGQARRLDGGSELGQRYAGLARRVQEDFVVLRRNSQGGDAAIAVYVCFPSGWRPERILGEDFLRIHAAVPEFDRVRDSAASLVSAMIERGPYVRFVWTLSADAVLDHHPEYGQRTSFAVGNARGYLRVERQLTVPFPEVQASLFLIRTYLYPFEGLEAWQRRDIASALQAMSPELRRYKGLWGFESRILELLAEPLATPAHSGSPPDKAQVL